MRWIVVAYVVALFAAIAVGWPLHHSGVHPLWVVAGADVAGTLAIFGFGVLLDNSSVYDPYWSAAPPLIGGYLVFALGPPASLPRAVLGLALVTIWSVRLTYNWGRRWQGLAHEDWRYVDIRRKTGRAYWLASLGGIHLLPTAWVFAGCLPLLPALSADGRATMGALDLLALLITSSAIAIEWVADAQLHRFLSAAPAPGAFLGSGLWGRCRHPNYLGELCFWWGLFCFGLAADPSRWWWTMIGPLSITVLFVAVSVPLIDRRMLARRPGYAAWREQVPALFPRPRPRREGRRA